jgi:hypothetical protein
MAPSAAPAPRPTRFARDRTPRPTHRTVTHRPTAPTLAPTPNYWASDIGLAFATSAGVGLIALLLAAAAYFSLRAARRARGILPGDGQGASVAGVGVGAGFGLVGDGRTASKESLDERGRPRLYAALLGEGEVDPRGRGLLLAASGDFFAGGARRSSARSLAPSGGGAGGEDVGSALLHEANVPRVTVALFWFLMLVRTGCDRDAGGGGMEVSQSPRRFRPRRAPRRARGAEPWHSLSPSHLACARARTGSWFTGCCLSGTW